MLDPKKLRSFVNPRRPYNYKDQVELRSECSTAMGNLLVIWNHREDIYTLEACQLPVKKSALYSNRINVLVELQKSITDKMSARHEMLLLWEVMKVANEYRVQIRHLPTFAQVQFWTPMEILPPLRIVYQGHREELAEFFGDVFRQLDKQEAANEVFGRLDLIDIPLLKQKTKVRKVASRK